MAHHKGIFFDAVKLASAPGGFQIFQLTIIGQAVDNNWTDSLRDWKWTKKENWQWATGNGHWAIGKRF